MNQKPSVVQILKSVPQMLTSDSNAGNIIGDLQAVSANAAGNATIGLVAIDEDMAELTSVSVVSGEAASLFMQSNLAGEHFGNVEEITVAGDATFATLIDVSGDFTVDVAGEGSANALLFNTGATSATISVGTDIEYALDADGEVIGVVDADSAIFGTFGDNSSLETITVSGATAQVTLLGDLTGLSVIDLTGVTEQFAVFAGSADFGTDLGVPGFVTYLIGGTSSEFAGGGDSTIDSSAGNRETFKFTEADFGTVVIDGFDVGAAGDRIDLSELGFSGTGQLVFQQGDYDAATGEFVANDLTGADVRILDDAGGPSFEGTIILEGLGGDIAILSSENFSF